jgi:hypothetical protein
MLTHMLAIAVGRNNQALNTTNISAGTAIAAGLKHLN